MGFPITEEVLDRPVVLVQENPKREGTKSFARYEAYKASRTLREVLERKGQRGDIQNDVERGFIKFTDGLPPPSGSGKRSNKSRNADGSTAKKLRVEAVEVHDVPVLACDTTTTEEKKLPGEEKRPSKRARYSFPRADADVEADAQYEIRPDGSVDPPVDGQPHESIRVRGPAAFVKDEGALERALLDILSRSKATIKDLHLHHVDCAKPRDLLLKIAELLFEAPLMSLSCAYCQLAPEDVAKLANFKALESLDLRGAIDPKHSLNAGLDEDQDGPYTAPLVHIISTLTSLTHVDLSGILDDNCLYYTIGDSFLDLSAKRGIVVTLGTPKPATDFGGGGCGGDDD